MPGEPFHFRAIGRRFFGYDDMHEFCIAKDRFETAEHAFRPTNDSRASLVLEAGLVRTAEDALTVPRQASQPLGPMGVEWLERRARTLKGEDG